MLSNSGWLATIVILLVALPARGQPTRTTLPSRTIAGVDISMLPEIEKAGGIFRDNDKPADAMQILRDHGCNLFRVRLFVDPDPDFRKTAGATQDLNAVKELSKRIQKAGGKILLDIHYSDTWADPQHQIKPRAWEGLDFDALERKVYDYTFFVLTELKANGTPPEMVQVGNEITPGVLWPEGKVMNGPEEQADQQWDRFRKLIRSGIKAVRATQTDSYHPNVVIHIDGGGKPGVSKWFFGKFSPKSNPVDFDIIALSFYPAWGDKLDALKQNMTDLTAGWDKDILVAETSYPWRPMDMKDQYRAAMAWPMTKDGQRQFVEDLDATMTNVQNGRGMGVIWWYPEAIPVPTPGINIWRRGAEALFDEHGNPLPAMDAFGLKP